VYWLAMGLFRRERAAFLAVFLLAAGRHAGIAESDLYAVGFTHTSVAFALGVAALALLAWDRPLPAFALAGALFNLHALTALYVMVLGAAWSLSRVRAYGWVRTMGGLALLPILAAPTLAGMLAAGHVFDENWVRLLHIRSAHHVFPSSLWTPGDPQVPRFVLLAAFGAVLYGAWPPAVPARRRALRATAGAMAVLLLAGVCFSEVIPVPVVLRAQLMRSSAFAALLALVCVAHGLDRLWDEDGPPPTRWVGRAAVVILAAALAAPAFRSCWPALLVAAALLLLWRRRLSVAGAFAVGGAILVATVAWRQIQFPLFAPPTGCVGAVATPWLGPLGIAALLAFCALLVALFRVGASAASRVAGRAAALVLFALLARGASAPPASAGSPWEDVQRAARARTPRDALILTPPLSAGFRIHSERSIVGEWRDGTQQFFSPVFAERWWTRMRALRPGLRYDGDGARLLAGGITWDRIPEEDLWSLCGQFGATHLVVPSSRTLDFVPVYSNADWALYRTQRLPPPPPPDGVTNAAVWHAQERFLRDVVRPNIERYRKNEVRVVLTDADGNPLRGATVAVRQVRQTFRFSCSLPHFVKPAAPADFDAGVVDPRELDRFREVFNASTIAYSGKWNVVEPEEGKPVYDDLDRYVAWCATNGVGIEFHFVTGYPPKWLAAKPPDERRRLLLRHTQELFTRYGDRISHWQVVNEKHLLQESPPAFEWIRTNYPKARLGIAECAQFQALPGKEPQRSRNMVRGMAEIEWLASKGCKLDFFAYHGHRPFGLWPDVREMYEALDRFRDKGLSVHISEFGVHADHEMLGPVRQGRWTPELQAEQYARYYAVCFSHPAVESINLWGMGSRTWMAGAGLLDREYRPKPAFQALKSLIGEAWRTRCEGRTGVDGVFAFRGFHGGYELTVTSPVSGRAILVPFTVAPGPPVSVRLRRSRAGDAFTVVDN
jgi:GH35 family endo-1,4-beta-xylanase